jgi:hypothetical protein
LARQKRNEPCACGSGKKYKMCHGSQPSRADHPADTPANKWAFAIVMLFLLVLVAWAGITMFTDEPAAPPPGVSGEGPPGKVWSEEHGHWH